MVQSWRNKLSPRRAPADICHKSRDAHQETHTEFLFRFVGVSCPFRTDDMGIIILGGNSTLEATSHAPRRVEKSASAS